MPEPIMSRDTVCRLYDDAAKEMTHEDAELHVAGVTGYSVVTIASVLAERESRHNAMEAVL